MQAFVFQCRITIRNLVAQRVMPGIAIGQTLLLLLTSATTWANTELTDSDFRQ